jgi:hypothetical protein
MHCCKKEKPEALLRGTRRKKRQRKKMEKVEKQGGRK